MSKTRRLTEVAIAIALAVVCHFIKVWEMPQGGAVSLVMVPILFIAFRNGKGAGYFAGAIYGLLSMMLDGTIYHPMSILLDYILAFGILGVAGHFPKKTWGIIVGSIVAVLGRFLSSFISGAVLFGSYAPEGQSPWIYSAIYNATYLLPELIITLAVLLILFLKFPKLFKN